LKEDLKQIDPKKAAGPNLATDLLQGPLPPEELMGMFDRTKKDEVKQTLRNCVLVFRHDKVLYQKIRYNSLTRRVDLVGEVPWIRTTSGQTFTNSDLRAVHLFMEEKYGLRFQGQIDEALSIVADENQYHPVRDYLNGLPPWDGKERIRYALHHFLGADADDYTWEVFRLFLLGAVSRVFRPGIKFDYMLCLVGAQGAGKSTFLRYLAVNDDWFCDDLKNLESDKVYEKMMGHWIIEMSEMMAAINAKTNEAIKSFLSRQKETFRTPYDRLPEDRPRQCVFVGTTNRDFFLPNDRTGNRRFLPIRCHEEKAEVFILDDEAEARAYVDGLWAEVMDIYWKGSFTLKLSKTMQEQVRIRQQAFLPEDVDAGMILSFMTETTEKKVCSRMLFKEALDNPYTQPARWQTNEICEIVNQLIRSGALPGWRIFDSPKRFGNGYGTQKGWEKILENVKQSVNGAVSTDGDFQNPPLEEKTPFDGETENDTPLTG